MSPDCQRCRYLLSAAMDGETAPGEDIFVRRHLGTCEDCRAVRAAYHSIRSQMRTLPHPVPPAQLRAAVMARTSGHRPVIGNRKPVAGLTPFFSLSQKMALGFAAMLVVMLGVLIILGLLRTRPFELEGQPVADVSEQKIVVTFSRPVDRLYVAQNAPELFNITDENGNKVEIDFSLLKIEGSRVELPVREGARPIELSDSIKVEVRDVREENGEQKLNPKTVEARIVVTPTVPTRTPDKRPATPTRTVPPASITVAPANTPAPPVPATSTPGTVEVAPTAALPTSVATATPTPRRTTPAGTTVAPTPPATATAVTTIVVTPTVTPTITPTVTPIITPTVAPTITPTVAPPTPTVPADVCKLELRRGFGKLYNERPEIGPKIGCPTALEAQASLAYQTFQRGFMVWHKQTGQIYVFYTNGTWARYRDPGPGELPPPNTAAPGATAVPTITPTPTVASSCATTPIRGFGNIWATNPNVRNGLGCPTSPETGTDLAAYQPFDRGLMLFNPLGGKRIYVVYNDSTYLNLVDTFVD